MTEGTYTALEQALKNLNAAQKSAVEHIDGPVLVIAGPGTGKTQLLSARVARILQTTDTLPQNILCLTFTESGAQNMRERLTRFIGATAYDVTIGTYHSFGSDIINRFPEYFGETRLQNPIDELGKREIVANIVDAMNYSNPLKSTKYHLGDLLATISEIKRALLEEADLRKIAAENSAFIIAASSVAHETFGELGRLPGSLAKSAPYFEKLLENLKILVPENPRSPVFGSLAHIAVDELTQALETATTESSSKPLTAWKNKWLSKDVDNKFILSGMLQNQRLEKLADVCSLYKQALEERGLYDFDDMILKSLDALEQNPDFRFTLQEQYLYLLLDEFQDTNAAQAKLIQLLTDNPVNEGRPNVMAVGDDDQAIYAFQGAQYSNMKDFAEAYTDTFVVNLTENYRSHADILHIAHAVADQIEGRLSKDIEGMTKVLVAANTKLSQNSFVDRHEFLSDVGQYNWIAQDIKSHIQMGTSLSEIAVLAPRHKQLEPLVTYLNSRGIPIRYEKRENILETPVVQELLTMSKLVIALAANNASAANTVWPEVLSFEFWQIPTSAIWSISWKIADSKGKLSWSQAILESAPILKAPALLMLTLAHRVEQESLETMLDYLIGTIELQTKEPDIPSVRSPLRAFYTSEAVRNTQAELFYETLSHLTVLRQKLRDHQATQELSLKLPDLISFVELYEAAEERMINTSPYNQHADAVQLMTVFKAKGLEFEHVYLPSCQDDVWGETSRGNSNRLTLPANLTPIRHAGANEDERLRIFFVAITRAKIGLHLASFQQTYSGKATRRLKYLQEQEQTDGSFRSLIFPPSSQAVLHLDEEVPALETLDLNWRHRHIHGLAETQLRDLLSERLENYQLSPTHLNTFVDMVYSGPETFFFNTILRFPQAPSADGQFGNAIHETLQWVQEQVTEHEGVMPLLEHIETYFTTCMRHKKLPGDETERLIERGIQALKHYIKQRASMFKPGDKAEANFRNESVFLGDVHMGGKVDRMEIDHSKKTITVVDYKTGKSYSHWTSDIKLHKYRQQLYCYKLLIEHSRTYKAYTVVRGRLEFIEPNEQGNISALELHFDDKELETTKQLLTAMWHCVKTLNFPDTTSYDVSLAGTRDFESFLLEQPL